MVKRLDRSRQATWYGGRPQLRPHCVRWGPSSCPHGKGHSGPPLFGRCLLWPNGRPYRLLLSTCFLMPKAPRAISTGAFFDAHTYGPYVRVARISLQSVNYVKRVAGINVFSSAQRCRRCTAWMMLLIGEEKKEKRRRCCCRCCSCCTVL